MIESKGNTVHRMNLVEASWRNHEKNPRSSHTFFSSHSHFYAQGLLWLTRRCLLVEKLKLPHDTIEVSRTDSDSQRVISLVYYLSSINGWCISDPMFAKPKCVCEVADIFNFLSKTFLTYIMNIVQWQFCAYVA